MSRPSTSSPAPTLAILLAGALLLAVLVLLLVGGSLAWLDSVAVLR